MRFWLIASCSKTGSQQRLELRLELRLHRLGKPQYGARLEKIEGADPADIGLHQHFGRLVSELLVDDRTRHHHHGSVKRLDRIRNAAPVRGGRPRGVDRNNDVRVPAYEIEWQRVGGAAVDQHT